MQQDQQQDNILVEVTEVPLSLDRLVAFVGSSKAGAISTFSGTTRDNFQGKKVVHLEYEAYTPMAEKELHKLARQVQEKWPDVLKVALAHRIGKVDIGEASVVIAISSPHRTDSLEAVQFAINEIKAVVPIWKKEFYEEGGVWKENAECCHSGPHRRSEASHADSGHGHGHGHHAHAGTSEPPQ
jgi:molybdopterin synthase catalytic subunit